jgi:hypothetical protein
MAANETWVEAYLEEITEARAIRVIPHRSSATDNAFNLRCSKPFAIIPKRNLDQDHDQVRGQAFVRDEDNEILMVNPRMGGVGESEWVHKSKLNFRAGAGNLCGGSSPIRGGSICQNCQGPRCAVKFVWSRGSFFSPQTIRAQCGLFADDGFLPQRIHEP